MTTPTVPPPRPMPLSAIYIVMSHAVTDEQREALRDMARNLTTPNQPVPSPPQTRPRRRVVDLRGPGVEDEPVGTRPQPERSTMDDPDIPVLTPDDFKTQIAQLVAAALDAGITAATVAAALDDVSKQVGAEDAE